MLASTEPIVPVEPQGHSNNRWTLRPADRPDVARPLQYRGTRARVVTIQYQEQESIFFKATPDAARAKEGAKWGVLETANRLRRTLSCFECFRCTNIDVAIPHAEFNRAHE